MNGLIKLIIRQKFQRNPVFKHLQFHLQRKINHSLISALSICPISPEILQFHKSRLESVCKQPINIPMCVLFG
ncbi:hypothetical protein L1887_10018 [Cichorium endivia]|nr:hypothetical protein L1887_10018 [Cichorium endivia]